MAKDFQKKKIEELESQLEVKNKEISSYLKRIENLEDTIMEIEASTSKKTKKSEIPLLKFQLKESEKEYRKLKDRMGYIRAENVKLKIELETQKKANPNSTSIKIIPQNPLSNQTITSLAKDIVYIENEIKKADMNKEEIIRKLRHFMKIIREG